MATIEKAIQVAAQAHAGTVGKDGEAYIFHPIRVMMRVNGDEARIVAILHDVVEDSDTSVNDLRAMGFSKAILQAVQCVTHAKGETYADYVVRCNGNDTAREVKLADLRDNAHLSRLLMRPASFRKDSDRLHRYILSYRYLEGHITEQQFRDLIANFEKAGD